MVLARQKFHVRNGSNAPPFYGQPQRAPKRPQVVVDRRDFQRLLPAPLLAVRLPLFDECLDRVVVDFVER